MNRELFLSRFAGRVKRKSKKRRKAENVCIISVRAADVRPEETLVITGNRDVLGNWQPEESPKMDDSRFPVWTVEIDAAKLSGRVEYKFCTVDTVTGRLIRWEDGENRILYSIPQNGEVESEPELRVEPLMLRLAGTAVPVFSLRTGNSFGIGDFGDLIPCIDWLHLTSQRILQLLPINDTTLSHTRMDSYPYNAISAFALNPLYLNLRKLGRLADAKRRSFYRRKQRELNALPALDYEQVDYYKWEFFKEIFLQDGKTTLKTREYKAFYEDNRYWLASYARFSAKRDGNEKALYGFLQYHLHKQLSAAVNYAHAKGIALKGDIPVGVNRAGVDAKTNAALFNLKFQTGAPPDNFSDVGQNWGFPTCNWEAMEKQNYSWWKKRLGKMSEYFDAYRIDHVLGFFRIWEIPQNYNLGLFGCFNPAYPYSGKEILGMGFPFDPKLHATLRKTDTKGEFLFIPDPRKKGFYHPAINAHRSDVYRNLPDMMARELFDQLFDDYFNRRNIELWKQKGLERLRALIGATGMLACGEDLGMIPSCVPHVMGDLKILSLEIERMPKQYGREFTDLKNLPYLSVCTTSTHDMNTIRLWWKENRESTQRYYSDVLNCEGEAPDECTEEICEQIIRNHLNSNSMLVILPLQDWLSIDRNIRRTDDDAERINIPADPHHYWRYRMHISFEDLIKAEELNGKIRRLIRDTGRVTG
ncbi:MAG: 4-alpha-glucanotransferase [Dysgonamonadaceae bacterium]|jgi:4-alpha-glucanotransferase|nr:4-alpha-glucanotransferase [Dysgonamonadaceae bacterium]